MAGYPRCVDGCHHDLTITKRSQVRTVRYEGEASRMKTSASQDAMTAPIPVSDGGTGPDSTANARAEASRSRHARPGGTESGSADPAGAHGGGSQDPGATGTALARTAGKGIGTFGTKRTGTHAAVTPAPPAPTASGSLPILTPVAEITRAATAPPPPTPAVSTSRSTPRSTPSASSAPAPPIPTASAPASSASDPTPSVPAEQAPAEFAPVPPQSAPFVRAAAVPPIASASRPTRAAPPSVAAAALTRVAVGAAPNSVPPAPPALAPGAARNSVPPAPVTAPPAVALGAVTAVGTAISEPMRSGAPTTQTVLLATTPSGKDTDATEVIDRIPLDTPIGATTGTPPMSASATGASATGLWSGHRKRVLIALGAAAGVGLVTAGIAFGLHSKDTGTVTPFGVVPVTGESAADSGGGLVSGDKPAEPQPVTAPQFAPTGPAPAPDLGPQDSLPPMPPDPSANGLAVNAPPGAQPPPAASSDYLPPENLPEDLGDPSQSGATGFEDPAFGSPNAAPPQYRPSPRRLGPDGYRNPDHSDGPLGSLRDRDRDRPGGPHRGPVDHAVPGLGGLGGH